MKEISYEEALELKEPFFIDVRSPSEFNEDHIIGAVNLPVFEDEERKCIGEIYKLKGEEEAIVRGSSIVGEKLSGIIEFIRKHRHRDIVINCFRGGMRSSSLVALLNTLGFNTYRLTGGYKGYRKYVRTRLKGIKILPPVFIIQGLTGTGKTDIIKKLENSIDLESMAGHRSSVFGGIGLTQNSQKKFEGLLLKRITDLNHKEYVVIEGESRKIGNLHIPENIMYHIYNSPLILLTADIQRRINIIINEYTGSMNDEEVIAIVKSLESRIGKKNVLKLLDLFISSDLAEFVKLLLERYYDPLYSYSIDQSKVIDTIENIETGSTCEKVKAAILSYLAMNK